MSDTAAMRNLARKALGGCNTPKAYRDLPASQKALTLVTLPDGQTIKLFGFAHERQTATATRKQLRALVPVAVAHVVIARASGAVIETRANFIDNESGISRRAI
jgi:hypothetical protein